MAINLPITPPLEERLREQLATGRFQNAADVISAALHLLEGHSTSLGASADMAFGLWKGREKDGLAYERCLRDEWPK